MLIGTSIIKNNDLSISRLENSYGTIAETSNNYSIININHKKYLLKEFENEKIIGQEVLVSCDVELVKNHSNIYQFNFQKFLLGKNVKQALKNCSKNIIVKNNFQTNFIKKNYSNNLWLQSVILPKNSDNELTSTYKNLGLNFLFNVNGYLISTAYYLIDKIFWKWKKWNKLKSILLIPLIANIIILNFPLEIFRVFLSCCFNIFSSNYKIKINFWNKNVTIWICLLFLNPMWFLSTGFLYNFIIALFANFYYKNRKNKTFLKNLFFWSSLIIPLQAFLNYDIKFLLIFFQILIQPFLAILLFITEMTFLIPKVEIIYNFFYNLSLNVAKLFSAINLTWNIGFIEIGYYFIYYCLLYLFLKIEYRLILKTNLFLIQLILVASTININKFRNNENSITMINVGNGNSFFLHDSRGVNIFFDIGSGIGKPVTTDKDFLKFYGFNIIDAIFISHTDQDHNNNIQSVMKNNIIKAIYKNDYFFREINIKHINIKNFEFYNERNPNDSSQVLYVNWNNLKLLFTGDLPKRIEQQLIKDQNFVKLFESRGVDFLQVPHHGSKTSSSKDFIKLINPKYCFISGEHKGRLQFPNQQTIETLKLNNCRTYSTLGQNTIKFQPNSKNKIKFL
ncbi:ComEC/Rec2 family competence protein [Spiroplasma sabaudiense]|uniref:ComEC/Rec2 family competence protein n=1 Tax=Spiroplasma sabaudiense TaxID=216944 RepID=UPI0011DCD4B8|nr:ComEC/Rec2 family competence protein [Spiroplasma sabaudiense]